MRHLTTYVEPEAEDRFRRFKREEEARRGRKLSERETLWPFVDHEIVFAGPPPAVPRGILHRAADECIARYGEVRPSAVSSALASKGFDIDARHLQRALGGTSGLEIEKTYMVLFEKPRDTFTVNGVPYWFFADPDSH